MGVETAAMLIGGGGAVASGVGNIMQGRREGRRARRMEDRAMEQFSRTQQPGFLESLLQSGFNTGQDGQMQALRAVPGGQTFDTSGMFEALQPLRQRQLQSGLGELRSSAPGLGQRFGSAMMRDQNLLTQEHLQNIAAQDAGIQMQAFESGQGRAIDLMRILAGLEGGRQGQQLQALQIAGGMPASPQVAYGQPGVDIGQMLLLQQLLG